MAKLVERGFMLLGEIARWPRNPKDHDVPSLLGSMRRHGFIGAVTLDATSGKLVAGHGRLDALVDMQRADHAPPENIELDPESGDWRVPVDVYKFASESEAESFLLADNQLTMAGGWDRPLLAEMVERHLDAGGQAALSGSGFTQEFVRDLLAERRRRARYRETRDSVVDEDHVVEAQERWSVEPGQVWRIPSGAVSGSHFLACGDFRAAGIVEAVLGRRKADLAVMDPPYNADWHSTSGRLDRMWGGIANDALGESEFVSLMLDLADLLTQVLRDGGSSYLFMSADEYPNLKHQLGRFGLTGRPIIWAKPSIGPGHDEYRSTYEVVLFSVVGDRKLRIWNGGKAESNLWKYESGRGVVARRDGAGMVVSFGLGPESAEVHFSKRQAGTVRLLAGETADLWELSRTRGAYLHPTQKPVSIYERAIRNSSDVGNLVIDFFAGSGTVFEACENLSRLASGVELVPSYCSVTLERLAGLGLDPVLHSELDLAASAETAEAGEDPEQTRANASNTSKPKKTRAKRERAPAGGDS